MTPRTTFEGMFGWNKKYEWGIALGGGGARGFAHLGVLQALREKGIEPDVISGVSAGAIAGVLIASGKTPEEAFEVIKDYKFYDFTKIRLPKSGLLSLDKLRTTIEKEVKVQRIEDLKIPVVLAVTNVLTGQAEYLREGEIGKAVQASASIPVLFSPVEIEDQLYVDGGLLDNLPYKPLLESCKKLISVSISPVQELKELDGLISIAARTFQLSVSAERESAEEECDIFIEPPRLSEFDLLDTSSADEIFNVGYEYTRSLNI